MTIKKLTGGYSQGFYAKKRMLKNLDKLAYLALVEYFDLDYLQTKFKLTKNGALTLLDKLTKQKQIYKVEPYTKNFVMDRLEEAYHTNVMLRVKLPLPPTDNQRLIYNPTMKRFISSSKYRNWVREATKIWNEEVQQIAKDKKGLVIPCVDPTYENQIKFSIAITLPDKRTDFSNYVKAIKDFFTGKLYTDDKWVNMTVLNPVKVDKLNAGFEIFIWVQKQKKATAKAEEKVFLHGETD